MVEGKPPPPAVLSPESGQRYGIVGAWGELAYRNIPAHHITLCHSEHVEEKGLSDLSVHLHRFTYLCVYDYNFKYFHYHCLLCYIADHCNNAVGVSLICWFGISCTKQESKASRMSSFCLTDQ